MVAIESKSKQWQPWAKASAVSLSLLLSALLGGSTVFAQPRPSDDSAATPARDSVRVLYYEGAPRHEVGFIRRALADAPDLELVAVVRLSPGQVVHTNAANRDELRHGFPEQLAELRHWDVLVLGDIEAGAFSLEQLELITEYVDQGGGLLLLGGAAAFTAGDWKDSPLEPLLPVDLFEEGVEDRRGRRTVARLNRRPALLVTVMRTPEGAEHPALMKAAGGVDPFDGLPQVSVPVAVAGARWEATPLLEGASAEGARTTVLAVRPHGAGRSAVLTVQDTWRWQMQLPLEDERHERFWWALFRWLAGCQEASDGC